MEKNARLFIWDNMLSMAAYWVCSGTIVAGLTSYYNLPVSLANLLTGLTGTLLVLQLAGGAAYGRSARPFAFLRFTNSAWRLVMPLAFFSVLLPRSAGIAVLAVSLVLSVAIYQFACPAQTDWLVSHVEGRVKGNFYAVREMCFMLLYSVLFCAASLLIDNADKTGTQQRGFVLCGIFEAVILVASTVVLLRLPAPQTALAQQRTPLRKMFTAPLQNKAFRRVLVANMLWCMAGMFGQGYAAVYQIRVMHLPFFTIMVYATVGNLVRSLLIPVMAKLAAHITWKNVCLLCMGIMLLNIVGWMLVTRENIFILFPVLSVLGAVPYAGMGVGFLQLQVDTSPAENRSMYFSVISTMNGVASLAGSVLCSALIQLLDTMGGEAMLRWVFAAGIVGTLASMAAAQCIRSKTK